MDSKRSQSDCQVVQNISSRHQGIIFLKSNVEISTRKEKMKNRYTVQEVAGLLEVSSETVRQMVALKLIPRAIRIKKVKGKKWQYIIPKSSIDEMLKPQ